MPFVTVTTNVKITDVKQFATDFCKLLSETFETETSNISVCYNYSEHLMVNGSFDPGCFLYLSTVLPVDQQSNDKHTPPLIGFLKKRLGISETGSAFIVFDDARKDRLAYDGATVATHLANKK